MTPAVRRTVALRALGIVGGIVIGTVGMLAWEGGELLPAGVGVFLVGAVLGELLPLQQPNGATLPMSLAVIGAMALIGTPPHTLAAFAGSAWLIAAFVQNTMDGKVDGANLPRRVLGGWTLSAIAILATGSNAPAWVVITPASFEGNGPQPGLNTIAAVVVGLVVVGGIPLTEALMVDARANVPIRLRVRDAIRSTWQATVAISATAALGAMVHPVLGVWTVPLMLLPLWAARLGLRQHRVVQNAYDQTIRAMSRLPEQLGSLATGHGVRVGRLSVGVANELGMPDQEVATVQRAAYLHQIGRVPLEDMDPSPLHVAEVGAGILREAGDLDDVAEIVMATANLKDLGFRKDLTARGARIVWASAYFDRYAPDYHDADQVAEVMVRLVRDVGDIEVVAALSRVTERRRQPAIA